MFVVPRVAVLLVFLLAGCLTDGAAPPAADKGAAPAAVSAEIREAAEQRGDIDALIQMGDAAASPAEALTWYCNAARQGSGAAQYKVGRIYANSVKKSRTEEEIAMGHKGMATAMVWLDAAIKNGSQEARALRKDLALKTLPSDIDLYVEYSRLGAGTPCEREGLSETPKSVP